jgi:hypothetical protein
MNVDNHIVRQYDNFLPTDVHQNIQALVFQSLAGKNLYHHQKEEGHETLYGINTDDINIQFLQKKIATLFHRNTTIDTIVNFLVYYEDTYKPLHIDNQNNPTIKNGIVYYLNDDYEGGEINYTSLNLTIKPKGNSLVIHSAGLPHEVLPIKSKKLRFAFATFAHSDTNEEPFINNEVETDDSI